MTKAIEYPDFFDLVSERTSCRSFAEGSLSRDEVMAVIETARLAPSACNKQPWKFMIIDDPDSHSAVCSAYDRDWFRSAPVYIIALGSHAEAWHRPADGFDSTTVDVAIACEHICLAATSLALGSCWVCAFDAQKLRAALNIPKEWDPIAIIPIGYRAQGSPSIEKKRKTIDEIIQWGKF